MFQRKITPVKSIENTLDEKQKNMLEKLNSDLPVVVSTTIGSQSTTLAALFKDSKESNKPIVYTFTPGPFKDAKEMPADWMATESAVGCTAQLTEFETQLTDKILSANVYAINTHTSHYQSGPTGLLSVKKFAHFSMISDANGELQRTLGLDNLSINGKSYLTRFSVVIKPDGSAQFFELVGSVNAQKAKDHLEAIVNFISPAPSLALVDEVKPLASSLIK